MDEIQFRHYTVEDIYNAFDMGLETAIYVLEEIEGLSFEAQSQIVDHLKKEIEESKIKCMMSKD